MVVARDHNTGLGHVKQPMKRHYLISRAGLLPWLPVWMSLGIGGWLLLPFHPAGGLYAAVWAVTLFTVVIVTIFRRRAVTDQQWQLVGLGRMLVFITMAMSAGFSLAGIRSALVAAPVLGFRYYGPIEGRVVGIDRSGNDRMRVTLDGVVLRNFSPLRTPHKVRLSLIEPAGATLALPEAGAQVMLTGHLGPPLGPAEPGGFDFRRFAWFEGLGAIGYTRTPIMVIEPAGEGGAQWVTRLRLRLSEAIRNGIPGQAGAVASAVTTGDRSGIARSTDDIMRDSNLYHIVSISGLHMSLLAGFLYTTLRLIFVAIQMTGALASKPAHKLAALGALLGALAYMILAGGGVATERSFLMVAVMLGAILVDRRAVSLRTVALAAAILLAIMPEALANAGFQMSFAATVALIVVNDYAKNLGKNMPRWVRATIFMALTSIVAGAVTGPIAAAQFNRLTHYGLIANMAAVPVIGVIVMPAAVLATLLGPLGLAQPALWAMGIGTEWMLWVAAQVSEMSGSVSAVRKPPNSVLPMMGFAGALLALTPWAQLPEIVKGKRSVKSMASLWIAILLLGLVLFNWLWAPRPALLIAPEGQAVGLMTPAGRSPSKPSGGSFSVERWLVSDGDLADQALASQRPAWHGPRNERRAELPWGGVIYHITGKDAEDLAALRCHGGAMIVMDRAASGPMQDCIVFDTIFLKETGAIAFDRNGAPVSADAVAGRRPWIVAGG